MSETTKREGDEQAETPAPSSPDDRNAAEGGLFSHAIRRTDNDYHGRKSGEALIGKDIPIEEQDREAEEAEEDEEYR